MNLSLRFNTRGSRITDVDECVIARRGRLSFVDDQISEEGIWSDELIRESDDPQRLHGLHVEDDHLGRANSHEIVDGVHHSGVEDPQSVAAIASDSVHADKTGTVELTDSGTVPRPVGKSLKVGIELLMCKLSTGPVH